MNETALHVLVQRERELETIERMVADASGRGALVVVEGPPGIGKSRLLAEARERARACGRTVLAARATELEREFPFGVVRQLFESRLVGLPARERRRLLSGPALGAAAVFPGLVADVAPDSGDVSFARLHGLYWLTANVASAAPLLIVIDDLHWADTASLRWLLYLLPRLEDLPLLMVVARRPDVPDADAATHAAIVDDPLATVLRPGALGSAAVARMLAAELGRVPDPEFTAACVAATGGNPLFLRELIVAITAEGLEPVRDGLTRLDEIGGQAISRLVEVRLSCLPGPPRALARACAVLGDGVPLSQAAQLAGLDPPETGDAVAALERAGILRADDALDFLHPLIHEAVRASMSTVDRHRAHGDAARLLHAGSAEPERVSAHLLACPPLNEGWEQQVLEEAARRAQVRGASESAVAYLRRALEGATGDRLGILLRLGAVEALVDGPAAARHLGMAHELLTDPDERAECAAQLARVLLFLGRPDDVAALVGRKVEPGSPAQRRRLEVHLANGAMFEPHLQDAADQALSGALDAGADDLAGRMKLGLAACRAAWGTAIGADEALGHARSALAGDLLLEHDNGGGPFVSSCWVIEAADQLDEGLSLWELSLTEAQRRGSAFANAAAKVFRAGNLLARGSLAAAEADAREAIDAFEVWGIRLRSYPRAILAGALLERGDVEAAASVVGSTPAESLAGNGHDLRVLDARARVRAASGQHALALAEFLAVGEGFAALGGSNPAFFPWRSSAAEMALRLEDGQRARALAEDELTLARRWGAPRPIAGALIATALVAGGSEGLAALEEAASVLEDSPARLAKARALVEFGAALRRANRRAAARDPLRRGLEQAFLCGATPMVNRASTELRATGARPRRLLLSGVDALTPSERRVAAMAAQGATNREIAQHLFVTPKTVEVHLGGVFRKLGITSRTELDAMLPREWRAPGLEDTAPASLL